MSKEEKLGLLLEVYEQEKERLNNDYNERLAKLKSNEITESSYKKLVEWKQKEKAAIEHRFKKAIMAIEG